MACCDCRYFITALIIAKCFDRRIQACNNINTGLSYLNVIFHDYLPIITDRQIILAFLKLRSYRYPQTGNIIMTSWYKIAFCDYTNRFTCTCNNSLLCAIEQLLRNKPLYKI